MVCSRKCNHEIGEPGGYAGVMAANRLSGRAAELDFEVVLVDPGAAFTGRIRPHRVAAGAQRSAQLDWDRVLRPTVVHRRASAVRIHPSTSTVHLQDLDVLGFDALVYAVGSGHPVSALPSATTTVDALRTKDRLAEVAPGSVISVVGAGPTGIETAAVIKVARRDLKVRIVAGALGPHPQTGDIAVTRRLRSLGVTTVTGAAVPATGAVSGVSAPGRPADLTIWAARLGAPPPATRHREQPAHRRARTSAGRRDAHRPRPRAARRSR
jgi:NADH:ubiquinone reductase (H+-translocating)